jgi:hypothetical protein
MRKVSTAPLEQGTQAPSPAPDLIPAENEHTGNPHSDWYRKREHFRRVHERQGTIETGCTWATRIYTCKRGWDVISSALGSASGEQSL